MNTGCREKPDSLCSLSTLLRGPWFWIDWTWGLAATLSGFLFAVLNYFLGATVTQIQDRGAVFLTDCRLMPAFTGVSLGPCLFGGSGFADWKHEFGHTLQNRITGPFYFLVIGIPSVYSVLRNRPARHREVFCEKWADHLADRYDRMSGDTDFA